MAYIPVAPELAEKRARLQENLIEAAAALGRAKALADEIGVEFTFLDRTYHPKQQKVIEGGWDYEDADDWQSSGPGIGC
jgi:hypothetical protein